VARILVVEDEQTIALVLKIALGDVGHEVSTAPNGQAGLAHLGQSPAPDLLITDLKLPDISGRVLVETMSVSPRLKDIPVLIITGSLPGPQDVPPRGSYQALVNKPFDLEHIKNLVALLTNPAAGVPAGRSASVKTAE